MGIRRIGLDKMVENTAVTAGVSQEQARKVIKAYLEEIKLALCKGDAVALREFGTFSPKHLAEREGKNPQTGEMMHIKGKDTVRFKPSRKFVDTLND